MESEERVSAGPQAQVDAELPVTHEGAMASGKRPPVSGRQVFSTTIFVVTVLLALLIGLGIGYLIWGVNAPMATVLPMVMPDGHGGVVTAPAEARAAGSAAAASTIGPAASSLSEIATSLPQSYTLPIRYGALGPKLVQAGVIDLPAFVQVLRGSNDPLLPEEEAIVHDGSDARVTIDRNNAHFLLNFFWAVGLANRNALLRDGPLQQKSAGKVEQYASTGGWTLATKPIAAILGAVPLFDLTAAQQERLETVAGAVYRPCCGNSTAFPDCNHGMAMLGILELMAANDATAEEMFTAAKYLNTFWFPEQMAEVTAYFKLTQNTDYQAIDPKRMVGQDIASANGFQSVHQWLADNGQLIAPATGGASCGT